MALQGKWAILYYGILGSITGGWLPLRAMKVGLTIFHIFFFLLFIFFPYAVFLIRACHWSGWFVYSLVVIVAFAILKIVNHRLHLSLGNDPVPEEEEEEAVHSEEDREAVGNGVDDASKEQNASPEKKTVSLSAEESEKTEESFRRHRDSASTLGMTSSAKSGGSQRLEMHGVSTDGADSNSVESEESGAAPKELTSKSKELGESADASVLALMSPVHRSNSTMNTSTAAIASISGGGGGDHMPHHSDGEDELGEGTAVQRSYSMPPAMFTEESFRLSRDRERSGICIQHNQGSRHRRRPLESQSEDELTTSSGGAAGGGEEEEEEEEGEDGTGNPTRRRRNAFRGGTRVARRATCAADGNISAAANTVRQNAIERAGTPVGPSSSTIVIPIISEEDSEPNLLHQVKCKLVADGHYYLEDVAHLMSRPLHEAIMDDMLPPSWYVLLRERIHELRIGHLSTGDSDSSPGAIYWFEVDGEWDFYLFQSDEIAPPQDSLLEDASLPIEDLLAYGAFMDDFQSSMPPHPPHPPPRPPPTAVENGEEEEQEKKPVYRVIPFLKATEVVLNFPRKSLEDYMDRNVSWVESFFTIFLAMMVCVIAALLLSVIDFYQGFWVFWFCFVVATAHFSLIKSVQDGPASPTPGQNNLMAMGRAIYFILCGVIALCIEAALMHTDDFSPLCVYSYNINSRSVLVFARNGLLIFILFFPVLFALGWLPQPDTFAIYFMEQIDMHIFGGTSSTGLLCSLYAITRNILVGVVLWPLGYAAFSNLESISSRLNCSDEGFNPNMPGMCGFTDRIALSFYIGALFSASFVLSRSTTNHQYLWELTLRGCRKCRSLFRSGNNNNNNNNKVEDDVAVSDPLEDIYCATLKRRLISDLMVAVGIYILFTSLSLSTAFCRSPIPAYVIYGLTCVLGLVNHYFIPHLKKEMPWLCCSEPIVKPMEWAVYEVTIPPSLSLIEKIMQWFLFVEKNILYPLTFLFAFNLSAHHYKARFGDFGAAAALTIAGMKILRTAWTDLPRQHLILIFTLFFFNYDYAHLSEGLPLNYFIIAILFVKFYDLFLKMIFIYIYIVPWQSSWSSAGHIIVQPLLIPHTPLIFLQTLISAVMSAPMNPIYASTLFFLSYVRPVKYWEKDYNTKRADSSNTRLDTQLEGSLRNPNPDRLDSLFYEHLTWVLQKDLCGDLLLGRWGKVASGDFFILTSDRLNALVHIIEYGNGFVTFQLRGLEFRGTYCHQREVEAITESISDDDGCCYSEPGHLPGMLSCNKAFSSRWLAWEVVSSCYTLHGYSISENQAHLVFNSFDYRRGYITYYNKAIIYRLVRWSRLRSLLDSERLREALQEQSDPKYCDTDPLFDESRNSDYSNRHRGILKERFATNYQPYLNICVQKEGLDDIDCGPDSFLLTLAFAFTILGRRMFYQHAQHGAGRRSGDNFMNGLYRMFLGDARPSNPLDEWVFEDVDSIKDIIISATRISLKVHQDNFSFSDDYESPLAAYEAIKEVDLNHVVTHENDQNWRRAVVTNQPSLLALRYQRTEESYIYPYKLIRLTSKFIKFRVVKLNRECVRSLWTSQQHELIFLRNSDSERGSIQNHKPTLRNMVNSSMDLPIGYPIYVSPLQTSFVERHETFNATPISKLTDPLTLLKYLGGLRGACKKCKSCAVKASSRRPQTFVTKSEGGGGGGTGGGPNEQVTAEGNLRQRSESVDSLTGIEYGAGATATVQSYEDPFPQSDSDSEEQLWKPMWVSKHVAITDTSEIFDNFKMSWLKWRAEDEAVAHKAMKSHWKAWRPQEGMEGEVIHEWRPFHIDSVQRSHIDKVILLLKMTDDLYVLIKEQGVKGVNGHSV